MVTKLLYTVSLNGIFLDPTTSTAPTEAQVNPHMNITSPIGTSYSVYTGTTKVSFSMQYYVFIEGAMQSADTTAMISAIKIAWSKNTTKAVEVKLTLVEAFDGELG